MRSIFRTDAALLPLFFSLASVSYSSQKSGVSHPFAFQFPSQLKQSSFFSTPKAGLSLQRLYVPPFTVSEPKRLLLRNGLKMVQMPNPAVGKHSRETVAATFSTVRDALETGSVSDVEGLEDLLRRTPIPQHPRMISGRLPNGLEYSILPNANPPGRFECHLEVFAGSADELESQQGMAHMCEHVSYMGSRKRERLFGSSSQTNAQTDFHHTVYWAGCPTTQPNSNQPMLPMALDALLDVMEAKFEPQRVEKERAAILSEAAMVNTIDYRVEVQLLSALHSENRLHRRFPIGLVEQISSWTSDELKRFHAAHYRPNNAHLYVIGDVDALEAEVIIERTFGHLRARPPPEYPPEERVPPSSLKQVNPAFPPVTHEWAGSRLAGRDTPNVRVFHHELMPSFSLHIFNKHPLQPISSLDDFRRATIRRLVMVALQVRLNVHARGNPIGMIEFTYLDSPREACTVNALDMTADATRWQDAVEMAVAEVRRLALHGLTVQELRRCINTLLSDSAQMAAQGDRLTNEDMLQLLMESRACGHRFMDPIQNQEATELVSSLITLDMVNEAARELAMHIAAFGQKDQPLPSTVVACAPRGLDVTEESLAAVLQRAAARPTLQGDEVVVPATLIPPAKLDALVAARRPAWVPLLPKAAAAGGAAEPEPEEDEETGIVRRRLANGVRVNYRCTDVEASRGVLRVLIPGGRAAEAGRKAGSMAVGARAMQEGGAMLGWKREQVELFCVDHMMMAEITATEEYLTMEFLFPVPRVAEGPEEISGAEATFQVLHALLDRSGQGFVWEQDALERAKQFFSQMHDQMATNLEAAAAEALLARMCDHDSRFLAVTGAAAAELTLDDVRDAVWSCMGTDAMEVSISGDFDRGELEGLILRYLGTIPTSPRTSVALPDSISTTPIGRHVKVEVSDSDPRAVGYLAGPAPNRWGVLAGGQAALPPLGPAAGGEEGLEPAGPKAKGPGKILSYLNRWRRIEEDASKNFEDLYANALQEYAEYRRHPLFPLVTLQLLSEVLNRRLFSAVRERRRLTYDANFHLTAFDRLHGGWFLVTVTAKPELVEEALQACRETLVEARTWDRVCEDNLRSASYELLSKHNAGRETCRFWVEAMGGLQLEEVPAMDLSCIRDYPNVVQAVRVEDVQRMLDALASDSDRVWTCIGISGAKGAAAAGPDVHGHSPPALRPPGRH